MNKVLEGFLKISDWLSRRKGSKRFEELVTIDDLFSRDDVNKILNDVIGAKKDMKRLVVVWENEEGVLDWRVSNMKMSKFLGLLEMTKIYAMMDNEFNECGGEDD